MSGADRRRRAGAAGGRRAGAADRRLVLRALWNLRALGLFLVGPAVGVWLGAATFGMPRGLQLCAGVMFAFSLAMCVPLVRGEWLRLRGGR